MEAFEETDKMLRLLVEHAAIGKINLPERYGISALVTQAMGRLKRWSFQQWSRKFLQTGNMGTKPIPALTGPRNFLYLKIESIGLAPRPNFGPLGTCCGS